MGLSPSPQAVLNLRLVAPLPIALLGLIVWTGCDLGLDQPANRYEQLNQETKKLLAELKQVTDEATANEHLAAIEEAAANIRRIQEGIIQAETDSQGGGMGRFTNYSQATQWQQISYSARRQTERIRQADPKAGDVVDKALEGVVFPEDSGL